MEGISQILVAAFMLVLPGIAVGGLVWMIYDKLIAKRKSRESNRTVRRRGASHRA
jgi:hypothetical protein